eukprot:CAMPEP_0181171016 /NCGR_PEP_ID=MMETSP1096-20121128/1676_1 /TAXON_ID=156174 ORGANISM="Chrysochromulina ericina, Strain CCMP281" /NCGR_SAMPLE_ID=MMETSP1096 /ASSEMBLY_ACC=CAM_ASM_000453 /LENGTH=93 /DNA_ID=CAMNT_0023258619 /DNA_START=1864 /DNA_END=2142 /DNA_ORIENTATION=+
MSGAMASPSCRISGEIELAPASSTASSGGQPATAYAHEESGQEQGVAELALCIRGRQQHAAHRSHAARLQHGHSPHRVLRHRADGACQGKRRA